jgi:hypothetical protein
MSQRLMGECIRLHRERIQDQGHAISNETLAAVASPATIEVKQGHRFIGNSLTLLLTREGKCKGSTALLIVDFSPGYTSTKHRTQSLDCGIVLKGLKEALLDSSGDEDIEKEDFVMERGTNYAWRNQSAMEWARMIYMVTVL